MPSFVGLLVQLSFKITYKYWYVTMFGVLLSYAMMEYFLQCKNTYMYVDTRWFSGKFNWNLGFWLSCFVCQSCCQFCWARVKQRLFKIFLQQCKFSNLTDWSLGDLDTIWKFNFPYCFTDLCDDPDLCRHRTSLAHWVSRCDCILFNFMAQ